MHIGDGLIGKKGFQFVMQDDRFAGIPKILETPKVEDMDQQNLSLLEKLAKKK